MSQYTSGFASSVWQRKKKVITASTTDSVDSVPLSNFVGIRYVICAYNKTQNKTRMLDMSLVKTGVLIQDSIHSKIGSTINFAINANVVGASLELEFVNNESFDVTVELIKATFN